jgi:hypothetical protein
MNQYSEKRQVAALLKTREAKDNSFKIINGMVEFTFNGDRLYVPTVEAFQMLIKKVSVLEQRMNSMDNKVAQSHRVKQ